MAWKLVEFFDFVNWNVCFSSSSSSSPSLSPRQPPSSTNLHKKIARHYDVFVWHHSCFDCLLLVLLCSCWLTDWILFPPPNEVVVFRFAFRYRQRLNYGPNEQCAIKCDKIDVSYVNKHWISGHTNESFKQHFITIIWTRFRLSCELEPPYSHMCRWHTKPFFHNYLFAILMELIGIRERPGHFGQQRIDLELH